MHSGIKQITRKAVIEAHKDGPRAFTGGVGRPVARATITRSSGDKYSIYRVVKSVTYWPDTTDTPKPVKHRDDSILAYSVRKYREFLKLEKARGR